MKLFEILKQQGLFANDLRQRVKNGQISINGDVIKNDIELNIELNEDSTAKIIETGNFISKLILSKNGEIFAKQLKMIGIENLFDSNIDSELTKNLNKFIFVKFSKKESFILIKRI